MGEVCFARITLSSEVLGIHVFKYGAVHVIQQLTILSSPLLYLPMKMDWSMRKKNGPRDT
jgi:hypothetical protein